MYNLIGNSCIASWITTKLLNQAFINPFTWCIMDFESSYNLVKNWENINFNNYELVKDNNWNFSIIIDKIIKVQYVHYHFDKNANSIISKNNDIFYNKIWEYIIDKYVQRINRMLELKIEPVFMFACAKDADNKRSSFTIQQQKMLEELNTKYKIILSFDNMIQSKNFTCIEQNKNFKFNDIEMAAYIFNKLNF